MKFFIGTIILIIVMFGTVSTTERLKRKANISERGIMDRLNAKQKIALNQMINFYVLEDVKGNNKCKEHSIRYKYGLRNFEPWALKMIDSSSKLQPGILNGNIMEFGDFKECVNVFENNDGDPIRGKMCTLTLIPGEDLLFTVVRMRNVSKARYRELKTFVEGTRLYWDVCVPDTCRREEVLDHFQKRIGPLTEGVEVNFDMDELDCAGKPAPITFTIPQWVALSISISLLIIPIVCTIIDGFSKDDDNKIRKIHFFSIPRNMKFIFGNESTSNELSCLHGVRAISIIYVIIGHRFFLMIFFPSVNSLDITEWVLKYTSTLILGGTVSVDSFFLISGLIVSYQLCDYFQSGKKFNFVTYFLYRYVRLTPPFLMIIIIYAFLLEHFGSGPLWKRVWLSTIGPCQKYWWSSLLYIQNYVNGYHVCILQTWYLSCEMQFYLLAPLLIYPLWKWKQMGKVTYIAVYVISLIPPLAIVYVNAVHPNVLMSKTFTMSNYFHFVYITGYGRSSTYIIGIGLGYLLFKTKNNKFKMSIPAVIVGWCLAIGLMLTVTLMHNHYQQEYYEYNRIEITTFLVLNRSAWTIALAWIVWACCKGYGGPVNTILSLHFFRVLGRLTYGMFLVHMGFQYLTNGAIKKAMYFANFSLVMHFFGDFCVSVILSIILNLTVEIPVIRALKMFTRKT